MLIPRIGEIIDEKGYKHNWVADQINVTPQQLSNWIVGNNYPRVPKLFELADFLNVKADDLYINEKEGNTDTK